MAAVTSRKPKNQGGRFAVVASRFNEFITQRLLEGCLRELRRRGVKEKDINVVWVPGAFEIPVCALKLAKKRNIGAVICLGAVIRGETYHFEIVSNGMAQGIVRAGLMTGKPVILGVLTADTVNQAYERSREDGNNKGQEAASAAVSMVNLMRSM